MVERPGDLRSGDEAGAGQRPGDPSPSLRPVVPPPGPGASPLGGWRAAFWLYALHLWSVFGLAASNVLLGLTVLTGLGAAAWRRVPWRRFGAVLAPLGLYALLLVVSIAFSYEPRASLPAASELFSLTTLVLALVLVRGERDVRRLVDGLILVAAGVALVGLGQFLVGYGDLHNRIRGPFSHYMTFAGVLLVADILLLSQMVCRGAWRSAWRWGAALAINLALLGSLTRSAWVAVALTFTVLVLIRAPRLILAYLPAGLLFLLLAPVPVIHRVASIADLQDVTNYDRLCMADAGLHMIAERPLFGLGPELVERRYPIYRHPTAPRSWVPHLHNSFLQLAAERGLVSLAAYLWLMGGSFWLAYRRYRQEEAEETGATRCSDLHMGVMLALLAFNVAGLFEDNWGDTEVQRVILFVLAIPHCLEAVGPRAAAEPTP